MTTKTPQSDGGLLPRPSPEVLLRSARSEPLEARFTTFFQCYWLAPVEVGLDSYGLDFVGDGPSFSAVTREGSTGLPSAVIPVQVVRSTASIDLTRRLSDARGLLLYLFGDREQAAQYAAESARGWSEADRRVLDDPTLLRYVPDVGRARQADVRAARDRYTTGPTDMLYAELRDIYARFTAYSSGIVPALPHGLRGVNVAAPGNPPEWHPPPI